MGRSLPHPTGRASVSSVHRPRSPSPAEGAPPLGDENVVTATVPHPVTEGLSDPTVLSPSDRAGKGRLATGRDREGE